MSEARLPDGTLISRQGYKAFGEACYQNGTLPTGRRYTSQLELEFLPAGLFDNHPTKPL